MTDQAALFPMDDSGPHISDDGIAVRYKRPVACSADMERDVHEIVRAWVATVTPIKVITQARFSAIHARLADGYKKDACLAAVHEYGKSEWHRKQKAHLDIARFFRPEKLDVWIQRAHERADAERHRKRLNERVTGRAGGLIDDVARSAQAAAIRSQKQRDSMAINEFCARPVEQQASLLEQAAQEAISIAPDFMRLRIRPSVDCFPTRQQLLVILRREP